VQTLLYGRGEASSIKKCRLVFVILEIYIYYNLTIYLSGNVGIVIEDCGSVILFLVNAVYQVVSLYWSVFWHAHNDKLAQRILDPITFAFSHHLTMLIACCLTLPHDHMSFPCVL
jgi:hypothetical protein